MLRELLICCLGNEIIDTNYNFNKYYQYVHVNSCSCHYRNLEHNKLHILPYNIIAGLKYLRTL